MADQDEIARKAAEATKGQRWRCEFYGSGSTNVHFATGDLANEHGFGSFFAPITLYNAAGYSQGLTDDGVQSARYYVAKHIEQSQPEAWLAMRAALRAGIEALHQAVEELRVIQAYGCKPGSKPVIEAKNKATLTLAQAREALREKP